MRRANDPLQEYADIIDLPHHVSDRHPQMPLINRAAQFAPFSALTGYEAVIAEAGRLTEQETVLEEDRLQELDRKLAILREMRESDTALPRARITFFQPDEKKKGGKYITAEGLVRRIHDAERYILLQEETWDDGSGEESREEIRIEVSRIAGIEILKG